MIIVKKTRLNACLSSKSITFASIHEETHTIWLVNTHEWGAINTLTRVLRNTITRVLTDTLTRVLVGTLIWGSPTFENNYFNNFKTLTKMIEFSVKSKTQVIGTRKGQTVYYAQPKTQQHFTNKMLVERIVRETSLSAGDVSNALVSLSSIVCDALQMGASVDLADLGSLRLMVPSRMMDTKADVTVAKALKTPKIVFTPKKTMREAANSVELSIDSGE